jgi:P27 family predicted phage terminase small subunit
MRLNPTIPTPRLIPSPPKHLSAAATEWWNDVVGRFDLDLHDLRLLERACDAWDRAEIAQAALRKHGQTYVDRFGTPRARPEINIARDASHAFSALVKQLNLDTAPSQNRPRGL